MKGCDSHVFATQITNTTLTAGAQGNCEVVHSLPSGTETQLKEVLIIKGYKNLHIYNKEIWKYLEICI